MVTPDFTPSRRPPKPAPFGGDGQEEDLKKKPSIDEGTQTKMTAGTGDISEICRRNLRRNLHRRKASLTSEEQGFLEAPCLHGNDVNVQLARERLRDENLFFDPLLDHPRQPSSSQQLGEEGGLRSDDALCATREPSTSSIPPEGKASHCIAGSERRQAVLQERRENPTFETKLWETHGNEVAISKSGSRRSYLVSKNSENSRSTPNLMGTTRSDNNRKGRRQHQLQRAKPMYFDDLSGSHRASRVLSAGDTIELLSDIHSWFFRDPGPSPRPSRKMSGNIRKVASVPSQLVLRETRSVNESYQFDDDISWKLDYEDNLDYYDSWMAIEDEYINGYGGGGTLPFVILGTSTNDIAAHPHVLSPPLMESLQVFLPGSKAGDNFWMKYSLVRDGASMNTFLQNARGAKHSFLAIETVDGEVFGAFTAEEWRKNGNYFGSAESFLWRMRRSRQEKWHSIIQQAHQESLIDIFPCTGEDRSIQLCTLDKIAVGGGSCDAVSGQGITARDGSPIKKHEWGFGLTIESGFLTGTTSPCLTFGSPSLSNVHSDGSKFEIMNLELWTLTPSFTLEDAAKLELGKLFLEEHIKHN